MAGCSLTVMWLDDELERFWTAPADSPAYRKGSAVVARGEVRTSEDADTGETVDPAILSDDDGRDSATRVARLLSAMAAMLADAEDELGRIDAVAGDGDHGRGMVKGSAAGARAADEAVDAGAGPASTLAAAGSAWASQAGGTSGVLWGALLTAIGTALGDTGRPDGAAIARGVRDGYDALVALGGAAPGDKTMLDALAPFADALEQGLAGGTPWQEAWGHAAEVATTAASETAQMRPRIGRARPLAERSVGTPDAGATSLAMCAQTVASELATHSTGGSR